MSDSGFQVTGHARGQFGGIRMAGQDTAMLGRQGRERRIGIATPGRYRHQTHQFQRRSVGDLRTELVHCLRIADIDPAAAGVTIETDLDEHP